MAYLRYVVTVSKKSPKVNGRTFRAAVDFARTILDFLHLKWKTYVAEKGLSLLL